VPSFRNNEHVMQMRCNIRGAYLRLFECAIKPNTQRNRYFISRHSHST